ncbi:helix-turn-helix domain-containing protein [uncultured Roseibium sp.]|uniref:helix-turn-helix domain-containing protein n=1 Tax=uncultured Roseibium sp. TaxID=1936171 RepID=UPI002602DD18|nr:helix-turn-helix domain-containing protein [uncultured Roseibium sp.]
MTGEAKYPIPNIKALRDERNMSLTEVAKIIDRSRMAINRIERGERKLTMQWAEAFANAFNVPVAKVFGDDVEIELISPEWLETEMNRHGLKRIDLADALGVAPSAITGILKGTRRISTEEAKVINEWVNSSKEKVVASAPARAATVPLRLLKKDGGKYTFAGKAVGTTPSLPSQINDKGAYAVVQVGFEMAPKYEQGDVLYAVSDRPARIGDYVVATLTDKSVLIRRLTDAGPEGYTLSKIAEDSGVKIPESDIERLDLIVGSTSV